MLPNLTDVIQFHMKKSALSFFFLYYFLFHVIKTDRFVPHEENSWWYFYYNFFFSLIVEVWSGKRKKAAVDLKLYLLFFVFK